MKLAIILHGKVKIIPIIGIVPALAANGLPTIVKLAIRKYIADMISPLFIGIIISLSFTDQDSKNLRGLRGTLFEQVHT